MLLVPIDTAPKLLSKGYFRLAQIQKMTSCDKFPQYCILPIYWSVSHVTYKSSESSILKIIGWNQVAEKGKELQQNRCKLRYKLKNWC